MPVLTDHHRSLQRFVGEWRGTDNVAPTQWGPGGRADTTLSARLVLNGFWLRLEHTQRRDDKIVFAAEAMLTFDEPLQLYAMSWFDASGFIAPTPATGDRNGDALILVRRSPRGMARHSFDLRNDSELHLVIENSFDDGASWSPVMTGDYRRQ